MNKNRKTKRNNLFQMLQQFARRQGKRGKGKKEKKKGKAKKKSENERE
jgi:hypothetical protein